MCPLFLAREPVTGIRFSKRSAIPSDGFNRIPKCIAPLQTSAAQRTEVSHEPTLTYLYSTLGPRYDLLSFLVFCVRRQSSLAKSPVLHSGPTRPCAPHSSKVSGLILALHNSAFLLLLQSHSLSLPCPRPPNAHRTSSHCSICNLGSESGCLWCFCSVCKNRNLGSP